MFVIGNKKLSFKEICKILVNEEIIDIDKDQLKKVVESFNFLEEFLQNKLIYGINTGLGPMAQYKVNSEDRIQLQYNAIRSHSAGSGNHLNSLHTRAALLARLLTISKGYSGVNKDVILLLIEFINKGIYPLIPQHGGVGASGDLVQLAHLALALIGEGDVSYKGNVIPAEDVFKKLNLKPFEIKIREGLSLINGTSVMTGIAAINTYQAYILLEWSILATSLINEIVQSFDDHFSKELNSVKHHNGQQFIAEKMREILKDSKLIRNRSEHLYDKEINESLLKDKVQEYYSLRCVPQILGPIFDAIKTTEFVVLNEINSVSDNPIVDVENQNVFHGGNFHGDYISFEMDKLRLAITKLSMLSERQLNYLVNPRLNDILPPFVNLGKLGLNFGVQGMQFTATSTVAENQMLSNSMYVHSISCNNDNQDIVSMGTNAALMTARTIENSFEVLAIEWITLLQAVDYLKIQSKLSSKTSKAYKELRKLVPVFVEDSVKYKDIKAVKDFLIASKPNIIEI